MKLGLWSDLTILLHIKFVAFRLQRLWFLRRIAIMMMVKKRKKWGRGSDYRRGKNFPHSMSFWYLLPLIKSLLRCSGCGLKVIVLLLRFRLHIIKIYCCRSWISCFPTLLKSCSNWRARWMMFLWYQIDSKGTDIRVRQGAQVWSC